MFYWYRGEHLVCRVINVFIFKDIIKALETKGPNCGSLEHRLLSLRACG